MHRPRERKTGSRNWLIVAGIIAAAGIAAGYGFVSGSFSSISEPAAQNKSIIMHIHPRLEIKVNGESMPVPAQIGIMPSLYKGHGLDSYGMTGMSPLHTHETSGTIHVESNAVRDYTLGEFFDVWGITFDENCIMDRCNDGSNTVRMYVDGKESVEFREHVLKDGEVITIEYGS